MTKQPKSNGTLKKGEQKSTQPHQKEHKWNCDHQIMKDEAMRDKDVSDTNQIVDDRQGLEKKIPRNAFLKLDLDVIALRMRKDLADRCCCADVPCVSIVKEYCESRY